MRVGTGSAVQHRKQVVILQNLTSLMDSECGGVCGGCLVMGGGLVNIMFLI